MNTCGCRRDIILWVIRVFFKELNKVDLIYGMLTKCLTERLETWLLVMASATNYRTLDKPLDFVGLSYIQRWEIRQTTKINRSGIFIVKKKWCSNSENNRGENKNTKPERFTGVSNLLPCGLCAAQDVCGPTQNHNFM